MRLRKRDLTTVYLKKKIVDKDDEGNDVVSFSDNFTEIDMNIQSAGGSISASMYGEKLPYIKSCKYQGDDIEENRNEGDGICYKVSKDDSSDFRIKSIQTTSTHLNVTLERIGADGSPNQGS